MNRTKQRKRLLRRCQSIAGAGLTLLLLAATVARSRAWAADVDVALSQLVVEPPLPLQSEGFFALRILPVIPAFGIAVVALLALAALHYLVFGALDARGQAGEEQLPWWGLFDRIVHGIVGLSFVVLAMTGLSITFGRILPTFGLGYELRIAHELAGFVFAPAFVLMAVSMARNALFRRFDLDWFRHLGGYLGYRGHLRAGKFNAGQKLWYWVMAITGVVLIGTGFALYFGWGGIHLMRAYVFVHFAATVPILLFFLVHVYVSTVAIRGQWRSMVFGTASRSFAAEHHEDADELKLLTGGV